MSGSCDLVSGNRCGHKGEGSMLGGGGEGGGGRGSMLDDEGSIMRFNTSHG